MTVNDWIKLRLFPRVDVPLLVDLRDGRRLFLLSQILEVYRRDLLGEVLADVDAQIATNSDQFADAKLHRVRRDVERLSKEGA